VVLVVLASLSAAAPAVARDFPEPISMTNPLRLEAGTADFGYHDYTFIDGPHDVFSLRSRLTVATPTVSLAPEAGLASEAAGESRGSRSSRRASPAVAAGAHYATYLMVGPVPQGQDPFSVAEWVMNAVQYEYAVTVGARLGGIDLMTRYGRTSQHPLVGGGFSEVSSDVVEVAIAPPALTFPGFRSRSGAARREPGVIGPRVVPRAELQSELRIAYLDLFDFWQSPLLPPRELGRVTTVLDLEIPGLPAGSSLVARAWPRVLLLRQDETWDYADTEPRIQMEIDAEAGLRLGGAAFVELLLELYHSEDSEQRRGEAAPLTTFGVTLRLGTR
jgi:hypothetical protein